MRYLAFCDYETTGLDFDSLAVLEFAIAITTENLEFVASEEWLMSLPETVDFEPEAFAMHEDSGLISELQRGPTLSVEEVDLLALKFIDDTIGESRVRIAGAGVAHFDVPVMQRHMPQTSNRLGTISLDISHVRRFARLVDVGFEVRTGHPTHRAHDDVMQCIAEARRLRENLMLVGAG